MQMKILKVAPFLEPRIVLLKGVAIDRVDQVEGEVGVQVKQRTTNETVHLESVAVCKSLTIVGRKRAESYAPAVGGVDVAEAVQSSSVDEIFRELTGRIKSLRPKMKRKPIFWPSSSDLV